MASQSIRQAAAIQREYFVFKFDMSGNAHGVPLHISVSLMLINGESHCITPSRMSICLFIYPLFDIYKGHRNIPAFLTFQAIDICVHHM